jgi:hypothetical protein
MSNYVDLVTKNIEKFKIEESSIKMKRKKKKNKKKNKGKCGIFRLIDDNLLHIISYLEEEDKLIFYGINHLLYEFKRIYIYYYSLSMKYSHKYCLDKKFRKRVNRRVNNDKKRRLAINLEGNKNITDVSTLGGVHTLRLYKCDNIKNMNTSQSTHILDVIAFI